MEAPHDGAPAAPRGPQPDHRVDEKRAVVVQQLVIAAGPSAAESDRHRAISTAFYRWCRRRSNGRSRWPVLSNAKGRSTRSHSDSNSIT